MAPDNVESPVRYPSDLSNEEWEILQTIFDELEPYTTGRPRTTDLREILNAIFYLNKTGCPWRYLPKDFPSYKVVNYYGSMYLTKLYNRSRSKQNEPSRPGPEPDRLKIEGDWEQTISKALQKKRPKKG